MNQGKTIKSECPDCKTVMDGFTGLEDGAEPAAGDISICFYCGHIGKYSEDLTKIETLSKEEMEQIKVEEPESYQQMTKLIDEIKKMKNN